MAALLCALLSGCATLGLRPRAPLVPVTGWRLPSFHDDQDAASLRTALERTLRAKRLPPDRVQALRRFLEILHAAPDATARRRAIGRTFRVRRVREPTLVTAYYQPELAARRRRDERFRYPLYARPPDLVDVDPALDASCKCRRTAGRLERGRVVPYLARADIERGALAGRGLEIAWTDDPFALFVLHVQGSGLLQFEDGTRIGALFAGTNGRRFTGLRSILVRRGLLSRKRPGTLPEMRAVLESLPERERLEVLAANERYTFFRLANQGPIGTLGVELTPERSVATDPSLVPLGTIGYLATPTTRRFVVSQDTGAAIVGAHVDLFLGAGAEAGERAGRTKAKATLYVLDLPPVTGTRRPAATSAGTS